MIESTPAAITHEQIAEALRVDPDAPLLVPTGEQQRVIEAPIAPSLVVAGAGSGKTQTMVNRMIWLVAHHGAAPSELLGLTFTRKAAGELRERVDGALHRLRRAGVIGGDEADLPEVTTYNSFANRVYREHALVIGREPEALLLDDAGAFSLMRSIVLRSDDPELTRFDKSVATTAEYALEIARSMRDNGVAPEALEALHRRLEAWRELPNTARGKQGQPLVGLRSELERVAALPALARLAVAFETEKRARGFIEFSDQVAGAMEICARSSEVADALRGRHRHVILDEYQDTSVGQTRFLAALFAGRSLMAVGDPTQSIYGWRGASAANMRGFGSDFGAARDAVFTLSTSWRNDRRILDAANALAAPLAAGGAVSVPTLAPRPGAGDGELEVFVEQTEPDEIERLAEWFADRFARVPEGEAPPSAAVLFRVRRRMADFEAAFRARGLPVRVLGLGGLMWTPEIVDLTSIIHAARDPEAGGELLRLLAGARFRLGVADLAALHDLSTKLGLGGVPIDDEDERRRVARQVRDEHPASLADAVAFIGGLDGPHRLTAGFSDAALTRIAEAADLLDDVRAHEGLGLVDFVEYVIRRAGLDLEAAANAARPEARRNLDAFLGEIETFTRTQPAAELGALLDWFALAADRDEAAAATTEPEPGAIQFLTVHGSKGLEWDLVAVPSLVEGGLPAKPRDGSGWFRAGVLPYPLRLDAGDLPRLQFDGHDSQQEARDAIGALKEADRARHLDEERRLAYVAVTRARRALVLSAGYWPTTGKSARKPSVFLNDLVDAGVVPELPPQTMLERPDALGASETMAWPREPFSASVRDGLTAAAADIKEAMRRVRAGETLPQTPYDAPAALLLRERELLRQPPSVMMPPRLAASRFKDLVLDPEGAGAAWRRPMPERPFRQTRVGTMFHAWVESRFGLDGGTADLLDATTVELDPDELELLGLHAETSSDAARLAELQAAFLATPWATRRPIAVEQTIELPLGGHTVVCKLDAVFEGDDGTIEVVDWKTGRAPVGARETWERQLQLALYTLAYSEHEGVPLERIRAVLVYVAEAPGRQEHRIERVSTRRELEALLEETEAALGAS